MLIFEYCMKNNSEVCLEQSGAPTVGIVYLAIGTYGVFWDDFYQSCERFLFPEAAKTYFVFTDQPPLLSLDLPNVTPVFFEDRGWMLDTSAKSECMISIEEVLNERDYVFYLNANYEVLQPILCDEILPLANNNCLIALSFHTFDNGDKSSFPYDRNPACGAFIPFGQGERYYQGGFYGGRTPEVMAYAHWCDKIIKEDLAKGIVATWHDESYLNKYLLHHPPGRVDTFYCRPEEWTTPANCKAICRDKNRVLGSGNVAQLKQAFLHNSMSFLYDKDYKLKPVHIVDAIGGLGNQLFQYAFLLSLQQAYPQNRHYWDRRIYKTDTSQNEYELERVFTISSEFDLPDELAQQLKQIPSSSIHNVYDTIGKFQPINEDWQLVTVYRGFWQSEKYFNRISSLIRNKFRFDESLLNKDSTDILQNIRLCNAVSIHFRRRDYSNSYESRYLYDTICSFTYYQAAIQQIIQLVDEPLTFYLFSDDPIWVKEQFDIPGCVIVDCNRDKDSWQDMCLMSACKHNIIENSSFSWWAAWLNGYDSKVVIAPSPWLNVAESADIIPEEWIKIRLQEPVTRLNLTDVTFVILFRIDYQEQEIYLDVLLEYLNKIADTSVLVLETGGNRYYTPRKEYSNTTFLYIEDTNPVFYRARYLNELLAQVSTPIAGIWNTDVILPADQILEAVTQIRERKAVISYPYDGHVYNVHPTYNSLFMDKIDIDILKSTVYWHNLMEFCATEGALFVDTFLYMQAGAENEYIYGCRTGSQERLKRIEILELPFYRVKGPLFRLHSSSEIIFLSENEETDIENRIELLNICQMTRDELVEYIQTWRWHK